jgi:hypothetical protein
MALQDKLSKPQFQSVENNLEDIGGRHCLGTG